MSKSRDYWRSALSEDELCRLPTLGEFFIAFPQEFLEMRQVLWITETKGLADITLGDFYCWCAFLKETSPQKFANLIFPRVLH